MNDLYTIILDDVPDAHGYHLTPEQRHSLFESWWASLSPEQQTELANANP